MTDKLIYSTIPHLINVGAKIYFQSEKRPHTVKALGERYAVCTKPFNLEKTVLYTIIDFEEQVRGREDLIFCAGFETDENCREALVRLESGETSVSRRHRIPLDIIKVVPAPLEEKK